MCAFISVTVICVLQNDTIGEARPGKGDAFAQRPKNISVVLGRGETHLMRLLWRCPCRDGRLSQKRLAGAHEKFRQITRRSSAAKSHGQDRN